MSISRVLIDILKYIWNEALIRIGVKSKPLKYGLQHQMEYNYPFSDPKGPDTDKYIRECDMILKDRNSKSHIFCIHMLVHIKSEKAINVLVDNLKNKSQTLRKLIIEQLVQNNILESIPTLQEIATYDTDENIKCLAQNAIENLSS